MSDFNNNQTQDSGSIPVRSLSGSSSVAASALPNPAPATIAAGATWLSGPISAASYNSIAAGATLSQAGTLSIQRDMDAAATLPIGAALSQTMTANVFATVALNDGLPFVSWQVSIHNTSVSVANLTNVTVIQKS